MGYSAVSVDSFVFMKCIFNITESKSLIMLQFHLVISHFIRYNHIKMTRVILKIGDEDVNKRL